MEYRKFYDISEETFEFYKQRMKRCKGVPGWEHRQLHLGFLKEEYNNDEVGYSAVLMRIEDEIMDSYIFRFHFL